MIDGIPKFTKAFLCNTTPLLPWQLTNYPLTFISISVEGKFRSNIFAVLTWSHSTREDANSWYCSHFSCFSCRREHKHGI